MRLHLLRHAHAGDAATWDRPDAERPLSDKGRAQAERLGKHLAAVDAELGLFLTSPKVRARDTAVIVAAALGANVEEDDRLAEGFLVSTLEEILRDHGDPDPVTLVGHDPDFSEVLATLIGARELPMRKGAVARVELDRPLTPEGGELRWLLTPDLLKR
ncbi:MAG TPA: histidine phosphatase family protein [Candidatus Saccharimonadales bacterium]|nr:histidine phosphatase family protein [Candidatus Saccharimonadales bacterium]